MLPHEMLFNLPLKRNFNIYVKSYATMGILCAPSYQWAATKKKRVFCREIPRWASREQRIVCGGYLQVVAPETCSLPRLPVQRELYEKSGVRPAKSTGKKHPFCSWSNSWDWGLTSIYLQPTALGQTEIGSSSDFHSTFNHHT